MSVKLKAGVFYGDAARTASAPGFRFIESSYQPGMNIPPHSHELAHFCLVLRGSYLERLGSACAERTPSTLIYYPPDTVHAESSHSGGRHLLIEIETWRTEAHASDRFARGPVVLSNQAQRWIANRLLREFRCGDELASLAMESLALELMVDVGRSDYDGRGQKRPRWLTQVKD